jgi:hypothetical protein
MPPGQPIPEDRLRDVASRVRHWGGSSLRVAQLLANALARIPDDAVRDAVLETCLFITIDRDTGGFYLPTSVASFSKWIVVLNED